MEEILIVVDMQNDFINGSLGTKEAQAIVPNVAEKIKKYKKAGKQVIFTRDTHSDNYLETYEGIHLPVVHCVKDTIGWQISNEWDRQFTISFRIIKQHGLLNAGIKTCVLQKKW